MSGFKIYKGDVTPQNYMIAPQLQNTTYPGLGQAGGLAYDPVTQNMYYQNNTTWVSLVASGGGGGGVLNYSMIKSDQSIVTGVETILTNFTATPSPPFFTVAEWNTTTGVFTAGAALSLAISVNLTWAANESNAGRRYLRVYYKPSAGAPQLVKESETQADPSKAVETTQDIETIVLMATGDQAWISVEHTSTTTPLTISGSTKTSISGYVST